MTVIAPNPLDEALMDRLTADTGTDSWTDLVTGGTWHLVVPTTPDDPDNRPPIYCMFGVLGPSEDVYTLGGWAYSRVIYGFDVIQEGGSAERAQTAARRLNYLLTDQEASITPTGLRVMACRRQGYTERLERTEGGILFQHVQSIFGLMVGPQ
jgi:hypothetical protein